MANLFALGLAKGMSERYSDHISAKNKAKAEQEAADKKLAQQKELATFQDNLLAAREEEQAARASAAATLKYQRDAAEKNKDHARSLLLEQAKVALEAQAQQQKIETAVLNTFGYWSDETNGFVGPEYAGPKRLPSATEMGAAIADRASKGQPIVLPQVLGNVYGMDEAIKLAGRVPNSSTNGIIPGTFGADREYNQGAYTRQLPNGKTETVVIPAVKPGQGNDGTIARSNSMLAMKTIVKDIPQVMREVANGNTETLTTWQNALKANGGKSLREALALPGKNEAGDIVIQNPMDFYGISSLIPDKEQQMWFATNIAGPAVGLNEKQVKRAMGVPEELSLTYDEVMGTIVIPDPSKYEKFTIVDDETGTLHIDPEIWGIAKEASDFSGVAVQNVLGLMKDAKDPVQAFKDLKQTRNFVNAGVYKSGKTIQITKDTKDTLRTKLAEHNFRTPEEGIAYIRALIKDNPNTRPSGIVIKGGSGETSFVSSHRAEHYGINAKTARASAQSGREAQRVASRMLDIMDAKLANVGLTGQYTRFAGGLKDIIASLRDMAGSMNFGDDSVRERYEKNAKALEEYDIAKVGDEKIQGQRLFDLLGEQLAFALASAYQKGSGGNTISDKDVNAQRDKLGLRGWIASTTGVRKNIEYIIEQMDRHATINEQYARSVDEEDFQATWLYDQTDTRSKTVDELLLNVPIKGITPETGETTPSRGVKTVKTPDGRTKKFGRPVE